MITETATVYRVGSRRFLTERVAFTHMARVRMAAMRECSCESAEYGDYGECYLLGYTCSLHDDRVRARYARLLRRAWKCGWRPDTSADKPKRDPNLHILQHALGLDDYGQGNAYRNHYVANEDGDSYVLCMAHVEAGRMTKHGPSEMYGGGTSFCFVVTESGRQHVKRHSPSPPRLTRSQKRYRQYLAQDTGLRFGEWLCSEWARGA